MREQISGNRARIFLMATALLLLTACASGKTVRVDYGDEKAFEDSLNNGENLEGKVVTFTAKEIHPDSKLGFNVWAGEHLNFVSERNPDIAADDQVTVRATTIANVMGSWVIRYEKVANAAVDEATIHSESGEGQEEAAEAAPAGTMADEAGNGAENRTSGATASFGVTKEEAGAGSGSTATASFTVQNKEEKKDQEAEKALELLEYGWYIHPNSYGGDTVYVDFCGLVRNPNETLVADYPKLRATVKKEDGSILATDSQTGSHVMPGDTVTVIGTMSLSAGDVSEDTQIIFDLESYRFSSDAVGSAARTTDFTVANVSERGKDWDYKITGEVTNNTSEEISLANLSILLRKEGKIVFMETTFLDALQPGKAKPFEAPIMRDVPEHDRIDVSVQPW